ncbi:MAG: hypothetical protein LBF41_08755, partial [Deltaproteobacteria bacterium]|nr:hypothetical protein [Deltaproteobacteria bacterium]
QSGENIDFLRATVIETFANGFPGEYVRAMGPEKWLALRGAVENFVRVPKRLTLSAKPPVPFNAVELFKTGENPAKTLAALNVSVSANGDPPVSLAPE